MPAKADCVTCHSPKGEGRLRLHHLPHLSRAGAGRGGGCARGRARLVQADVARQQSLSVERSAPSRDVQQRRLAGARRSSAERSIHLRRAPRGRTFRGVRRSIALRSRSQSTGLVRCSANPAAVLAATSSSVPKPLSAIPVKPCVSRKPRIKSSPLPSGKPRSLMTRSKRRAARQLARLGQAVRHGSRRSRRFSGFGPGRARCPRDLRRKESGGAWPAAGSLSRNRTGPSSNEVSIAFSVTTNVAPLPGPALCAVMVP